MQLVVQPICVLAVSHQSVHDFFAIYSLDLVKEIVCSREIV